MRRLLFIILALHLCASYAFACDVTFWEAKIPPGAETDPIALNISSGEKNIPNRDTVESIRDKYVIAPHSFSALRPKVVNSGIFEVKAPVPPDMAGTGPFYLVKIETNYYALTKRNFARLFGPIEKKSEVLPYLRVYEYLFGNKFAEIVTEDIAKKLSKKGAPEAPKPGQSNQPPLEVNRTPPKLTQVTKVKDGFRVTLITYSAYHIEAFYEKVVYIGRDGIVTE